MKTEIKIINTNSNVTTSYFELCHNTFEEAMLAIHTEDPEIRILVLPSANRSDCNTLILLNYGEDIEAVDPESWAGDDFYVRPISKLSIEVEI